MPTEEMVPCRTSAEDTDSVTHVPAWKYDLIRRAILHAIEASGSDGLPLADLCSAVRMRLSKQDLTRMGSLGWHCMTVELSLETTGEIRRLAGPGPQRLQRA